MIHYRYYADAPEADVEQLLRSSTLARLVTVGGSAPHLGLYPFVFAEGAFELHLHRHDEQVADLRTNPTCLVEVDQPLSVIPSYWIDPHDGSYASVFHRTIAFEGVASLLEDLPTLAACQARLMDRYQPEGGFQPLHADDPIYAPLLRMLVGVRVEVRATKIKFKLAQNRDLETRAHVVAKLRERGAPLDAETADALQRTIDLHWTTRGRRSDS